ncbi:GGDEF domain-containing protein [Rhizobium sp. YIM 134829]|uniref:GGDEF domain-containing protein n=1 Tax=Rhizobium sp. YIM 134829 TaxID=3390453 RepID=UPI003979132F
MPGWFFPLRKVSLKTAGHLALLLAVLYAITASAYSVSFLNTVEESARLTREQQIPLILSQNRNALKVERAASLIRSVYLAHDRRVERQIQLQLQTLCQSFSLDDNRMLIDGARIIAAEVKRIVVGREAARSLREPPAATDPPMAADDREHRIARAEADSTEAYKRAIATADRLSDSLSTDAVMLADTLVSSVASAASEVKKRWILILTLPVLFLVVTLWVVRRFIVAPIGAAILKLEAIGRGGDVEGALPKPLFAELATIADAVDSYGALSENLKRTNAMLQILSDRDGLTGLPNRRKLELLLNDAFARASVSDGNLAVMMIDLDHFKAINDTHGHKAGDQCLRAVADLLQKIGEDSSISVARYGGEEFTALVEGRDTATVKAVAERIRRTVATLTIDLGSGQSVSFTTSIGISTLGARRLSDIGLLLSEADKALYAAKHAGRNRVTVHDPRTRAA